jgi:hypothetical protein
MAAAQVDQSAVKELAGMNGMNRIRQRKKAGRLEAMKPANASKPNKVLFLVSRLSDFLLPYPCSSGSSLLIRRLRVFMMYAFSGY